MYKRQTIFIKHVKKLTIYSTDESSIWSRSSRWNGDFNLFHFFIPLVNFLANMHDYQKNSIKWNELNIFRTKYMKHNFFIPLYLVKKPLV